MAETQIAQTPAAAQAGPQAAAPVDEVPDTGHDYDGIRELDNHLPKWWLFLLYASIVFGFGYWIYYHAFEHTPDQLDEYRAELALNEARIAAFAAERGVATDDDLYAMVNDPAKLSDGQTVYAQFCASCHGQRGEGLIGPNLTDNWWVHGNKPTEILSIVSAGVPAKGMPAWESILGLAKSEHVVAYLLSIDGTNVPGKAPEGTETTPRGR